MSWYTDGKYVKIETLLNKTLVDVRQNGTEEIDFETTEGETYRMYHDQDCCESVNIEDITGSLSDLVGSPILMAEEVSQQDENASESGTWTFYKLATIKGYVTIRWYGESNGYYSESVDFKKLRITPAE